MRIRMIVMLGALALVITACGSTGSRAASRPRPPTPVDLSVYVSDSRVSVSPRTVGAGPVVFTVTNQGSQSVSLAISKSGQSQPLASTAPINPQGTTQVSVSFGPGNYTIATGPRVSTDAALAAPPWIRAASIHIGRERRDGENSLLQP
jgi:hypothetical protein